MPGAARRPGRAASRSPDVVSTVDVTADVEVPPSGDVRRASRNRRGPWLILSLLLAVAAGVRLGLLLQEWPAGNSDEGTMGLMAIRIAEGRDLPSFMDGQSYMGTLEAYAAAALFRVSGPSLPALRLTMLLAFLLFLVALHVLARRLYGTAVALVSVGLLALGSRELYGHELVAQGAVPETLLGGTLLLLLGHRLLETAGDPGRAAAQRWRLAGWGATATLALWSTVLTAPFVVSSGVLVGMALRRGAASRSAGLVLGGGLLAGALPWIVHDLTRPWRDTGVVAVVDLYRHGGTGLGTERSAGLLSQLTNTLTTSLAYITGGSALAHPSSPPAWPYGYAGSWRPPTDDLVTTLWGIALVVLWVVGVASAVRLLHRGRLAPSGPARDRAVRDRAAQDRPARARLYGRMAMLASAGLTVVAFAASPTPGIAPANNVRYLVGVLVAVPAVVAPLWSLPAVAPRVGGPLRSAVLGLVAVTLALGTVQAYRDAGRGSGEAAGREVLAALRRDGITHVYSGYLDCNRLTFLSREQVVCAVLSADAAHGLRPVFDRYLPYRAQVQEDPGAAYLFRTGDPRNDALARSACDWRQHRQVAGYQLWQPADRCPIPAG